MSGALAAAIPAHALAQQDVGGKRFADSYGARMAYFETGAGAPIVFLHGNPTSSYLWRNVIPYVADLGRCIAPDLIGMGDSDKLSPSGPGVYSFFEHNRRLAALLDAIGVEDQVTLVVHDWGGSLGFQWAMTNAHRVKAIAFMETFVVSQNDQNTPAQALDFFRRYRTAEAEREVLEDNQFVERVLLGQFPAMAEADKSAYRRPFLEPGESRRPTLEWPQQVPINGEPADVHDAVVAHLDWISQSPQPKLFIRGEPGALIAWGRERVCRAWPNLTEHAVPGRHFLPEEAPDLIGTHLRAWLSALA